MSDNDNKENTSGGGRSLGGGSNEPLPTSWSRSSSGPRIGTIAGLGASSGTNSNSSGTRFGTIGGLPSGGGPRSGLALGQHRQGQSSSDDDGDEGGDRGETWFAGGERSGISVQNPGRGEPQVPGGQLVRDLLQNAARRRQQVASTGSAFTGGGHTLGSDEVESTFIPDANAEDGEEDEGEIVHRTIYLWRNGFSVDDGPLYRFDDPNNSELLRQMNEGNAPLSILNVEYGQRVDVHLEPHHGEDYNPPKISRPFAGSGNRLGAPVPQVVSHVPGAFPTEEGSSTGSKTASSSSEGADREHFGSKFEVDHSQPTTSVQIRLADGTKMVCRMNLTHTVLDLRNFINASRPENLTRAYTIGTTFPNRILDDNTATIEAAGLKNSVVVQRWV